MVTSSGAGTSRDVYRIYVTAAETEQAEDAIARIFCPDPDHAPPCTVPWEGMRSATAGSVSFVFYATDDQVQEILAEVSARGFGEVRLFKTVGEDSQPIDGSTVIEQFGIEQHLRGS